MQPSVGTGKLEIRLPGRFLIDVFLNDLLKVPHRALTIAQSQISPSHVVGDHLERRISDQHAIQQGLPSSGVATINAKTSEFVKCQRVVRIYLKRSLVRGLGLLNFARSPQRAAECLIKTTLGRRRRNCELILFNRIRVPVRLNVCLCENLMDMPGLRINRSSTCCKL